MSEPVKKYKTPTAFLAVIACLLWASPFVPLKTGLNIFPYPLQFAAFRFIVAGLIMSLFTGLGKDYFRQVGKNTGTVLLIAFFNTALVYACFYMGQQRVDGAMGSLIIGSQPLFVAIITHFLTEDDKISLRKLGCILLGLLGIIVIAAPTLSPDNVMGFSAFIGILFLVGDNLSSAVSNVMISRVKKNTIKPLVLSSSQLVAGGVMLLLASLLFEGGLHKPPLTLQFFGSIAILITISTVAIGIWFVLLARDNISISKLNMWKFIIPVIGSIESWLFLKGERPTLYSVAGLALLTSSLVFLYWGSFRKFMGKIWGKSSKTA